MISCVCACSYLLADLYEDTGYGHVLAQGLPSKVEQDFLSLMHIGQVNPEGFFK